MRRVLLSAITAVICSNAWAFTASYEQTTGGAGAEGPKQKKVMIKDDKMRMEVDSPKGRTITIIDGRNVYSYLTSREQALKMTSKAPPKISVLADYTAYLESLDAKKIGSEKVGQYDCDIYELEDPRTRTMSKVWLWRDEAFPVKVENRLSEGIVTTVMENVKVGIEIDDSFFSVPQGIEIVEVDKVIKR